MRSYDFSGWATKTNIQCSDGRTIMKDAFKHNDGKCVPLVWNHCHTDPFNVLGKAELEHRDNGIYAYCSFNDTEQGKNAKAIVQHGDIIALSIYANHLKQNGGNVMHGDIKELSLVLAGANSGALIDDIMMHGDMEDDEMIIQVVDDDGLELFHEDDDEEMEEELHDEEPLKESEESESEVVEHADNEGEKVADNKTVKAVYETLNDEQKELVDFLVGMAASGDLPDEEGDKDMKHNVFESDQKTENYLSHADIAGIFTRGKQLGSLRDAVQEFADQHADELAHGDDDQQDYGIRNIDWLFPEAKSLNNPPDFIKREMGWVQKVMNGVHHTPFSRIKSVFADITEDEARAKGYIKGKLKKEEVFGLLKRTTTPTTIYKKQKLDRDDIIDITDFDVVAWLKGEMRMMLDEEIARAILIGDGRLTSSDDKIPEDHIRPIWKDADLYTIKAEIKAGADDAANAKAFIDSVIRSRKSYKGSGQPTLYTTEDMVTECLLLEDGIGHKLYKSVSELATTMRVKEIITVEVMEGQSRMVESVKHDLLGLVVNLTDYNVGADKGGAVAMFEDFDIDYNQQKYLIETRCSGALIKPFSAIAIEKVPAA